MHWFRQPPFEHIAGSTHRVQQGRFETLLDLAAQARDMHINDIGLRVEVIIPDMLQQHCSSDDLPGMAHQIFEQTEFARLEDDDLTCPFGGMRQAVEFEIADAIDRFRLFRARSPLQDLDAGQAARRTHRAW